MSRHEKDSLLFGNTIKRARLKMALSIRKAADLIDINFTYLNDLELNKSGNVPSLEMVKKIAGVLELDTDLLVSYLPFIPTDKLKNLQIRINPSDQKSMVAFYKTCKKEGISLKQGVEKLQKSLRG